MLQRVTRFGLGTTAVTNAITARRGVRVGLMTTRGFEVMWGPRFRMTGCAGGEWR